MPVVVEVIKILDTPFFGSAAPLDICVVVLALVVHIPDVVVGNTFGILGVDIASVLQTIGDYVCISDSVCACGDIAGPIYSHQVVRDSRALLENPEALGCREVVFAIIPQKVLILAFLRYSHLPVDSLRDKLSVQLCGVYGAADVY